MYSACFVLLLLGGGTLLQVWASDNVVALYGETIVVPCNGGSPPLENLMFIKWKYEKADGSSGDLLVKQEQKEATVQATDGYAERVSIDNSFSLRISDASLMDQRTFTCMVVSLSNLQEFPVSVLVHKKPSALLIMDGASELHKDKSTMVGTCVATDAHPAAVLSWQKNGTPLNPDDKGVVITSSTKLEPSSGLSTTSSVLMYTSSRDDSGAVFSCVSTHALETNHTDLRPLEVHYPTEKLSLQVLNKGPLVEGDNITLKCHADGNPPPSAFYFHFQGQKTLVENSDTFTLQNIGRDAGGEYKCSLKDNEKMEASQNIAVSYLELKLSPSGKVVKAVGEALELKLEKSSSAEAVVSWRKDGKEVKEPEFLKLKYSDAGVYRCEVNMGGITRQQSFQLIVEGKPVIVSLTKQRSDDMKHKELTCEAQGVPQPSFTWSINGSNERSSYSDGKASQTISVIPNANLSVTCTVTNRLGDDSLSINVSSVFNEDPKRQDPQEDSGDQAKLIVGVVVGLLLAAAVVALIYWLYMKNSRQGSWKTNEKEVGTSEESKKLEENNHSV